MRLSFMCIYGIMFFPYRYRCISRARCAMFIVFVFYYLLRTYSQLSTYELVMKLPSFHQHTVERRAAADFCICNGIILK